MHLELETGMGRTGISQNDIEEYIKSVQNCDRVDVQGIYSP